MYLLLPNIILFCLKVYCASNIVNTNSSSAEVFSMKVIKKNNQDAIYTMVDDDEKTQRESKKGESSSSGDQRKQNLLEKEVVQLDFDKMRVYHQNTVLIVAAISFIMSIIGYFFGYAIKIFLKY